MSGDLQQKINALAARVDALETENAQLGAQGTGTRPAAPISRRNLLRLAGFPGQLFVDKNNRLWFCKGSPVWKQLA